MEATIHYLTKYPEVIELVKQEMASLVGVTKEEEQAIIKSFDETKLQSYFWM
ncbi:competence pheromone ComX [Bacillus xiapuensis]|uniref:competence pheromone ComX n=1 Tax=Bacillus xiapuensis TaxID=2014075 RepID=UPI000C24972B|nr:competence pheromone ComX [Bacillus xiapuensis]